jgi:copper chaperone CopZ
LWAEEPSNLAGHARIRARISGLHCSLCTGTIEKALGRQPGVDKVAVSLTHEQTLVDYDPNVIRPEDILTTLRDIGYDLYDPRKLRPFEEEEEEEEALVREGKRLLIAVAASLLAIGLVADVTGFLSVLVPLSVVVVMVPVSYAILRPHGRRTATLGALGIVIPAVAALALRGLGIGTAVASWLTDVLALAVVFGVAPHILRMAYQSARRGILNQHVFSRSARSPGSSGWPPTCPTTRPRRSSRSPACNAIPAARSSSRRDPARRAPPRRSRCGGRPGCTPTSATLLTLAVLLLHRRGGMCCPICEGTVESVLASGRWSSPPRRTAVAGRLACPRTQRAFLRQNWARAVNTPTYDGVHRGW